MKNIKSLNISNNQNEFVGIYEFDDYEPTASHEDYIKNSQINNDKINKVLSLLKKENILNDNNILYSLYLSIVNDNEYITHIQILEKDILSNTISTKELSDKIYKLIKL